MLGKLLRFILLPKSTRTRLGARERAGSAREVAPAAGEDPGSAGGREQIMREALAVYRKQRTIYESLDAETRRQIEADAEKAFGGILKDNKG